MFFFSDTLLRKNSVGSVKWRDRLQSLNKYFWHAPSAQKQGETDITEWAITIQICKIDSKSITQSKEEISEKSVYFQSTKGVLSPALFVIVKPTKKTGQKNA